MLYWSLIYIKPRADICCVQLHEFLHLFIPMQPTPGPQNHFQSPSSRLSYAPPNQQPLPQREPLFWLLSHTLQLRLFTEIHTNRIVQNVLFEPDVFHWIVPDGSVWTGKRVCPAASGEGVKQLYEAGECLTACKVGRRGVCRKGSWKDGPFRWWAAWNASREYLKVFEINDIIKVTCQEICCGSLSRVEWRRRKPEAASPM